MGNDVLIIGKIAHKIVFNLLNEFNAISQSDVNHSMLHAGEARREFDGMALNVAYGLFVLGCTPSLVSLAGGDFEWYFKPYFNQIGVHQRVFVDFNRETACNYHLIDETDKKIIIKQNNCYNYIAEQSLDDNLTGSDLQQFTTAFVGTGKIEADVKFSSFLHQNNSNLPIIYSPDENIKEISKWRLSQLLELISVLICEESELQLLESKAKEKRSDFLNKYPRLKYIVSIENRAKTLIQSKGMKMKVSDGPATDPRPIMDWKDALRAGFIFGIANKKPIGDAAKLASSLASYCVESDGNHHYSPSIEQVQLRAYEVKVVQKEL